MQGDLKYMGFHFFKKKKKRKDCQQIFEKKKKKKNCIRVYGGRKFIKMTEFSFKFDSQSIKMICII